MMGKKCVKRKHRTMRRTLRDTDECIMGNSEILLFLLIHTSARTPAK